MVIFFLEIHIPLSSKTLPSSACLEAPTGSFFLGFFLISCCVHQILSPLKPSWFCVLCVTFDLIFSSRSFHPFTFQSAIIVPGAPSHYFYAFFLIPSDSYFCIARCPQIVIRILMRICFLVMRDYFPWVCNCQLFPFISLHPSFFIFHGILCCLLRNWLKMMLSGSYAYQHFFSCCCTYSCPCFIWNSGQGSGTAYLLSGCTERKYIVHIY